MLNRMNLLRVIPPPCQLRHCHLKWPSQSVRKTFIEFFKSRNHQNIRSSPVVPWNDPSLTFVNAGMNQFKPVFLNQIPRPCPRAANSQKCIRVGGKHNDLADVGLDTYHHTFFEMLGSWSFGDYSKEEACSMAWILLTEVYKLPSPYLYVTYFGGDKSLGLEADSETRDIWRSIGVPDERILPFGMRDNFWEMGRVGPCGPCTEIHYDCLRRGGADNAPAAAAHRVNLGVEDMIELWNLVFIQYKRQDNGTLELLTTHHVDTGMGLERLTAVLNRKSSNYDTDLFLPLFHCIQKMSDCEPYSGRFSGEKHCLDTAYRILADHTRMITVALADGMFPQASPKLRHVIKRACIIGKDYFGFLPGEKRLQELAKVVTEILGEAYPELYDQSGKVNSILEYEEAHINDMIIKSRRELKKLSIKRPELLNLTTVQSSTQVEGIVEMLDKVHEWKAFGNKLPEKEAMIFYKSFGLHSELIEEVADLFNLDFDPKVLSSALGEEGKEKHSRLRVNQMMSLGDNVIEEMISLSLPVTNDEAKYEYTKCGNNYVFHPLETKVVALVKDNNRLTERANDNEAVGVVLERTNFYHEAGGQTGDTGTICKGNMKIQVKVVQEICGYIIHWGDLEEGELTVGDIVVSSIDGAHRLGCMQHHTATHLLNSAVKAVTGVSCQQSSHVAHDHLSFGVCTYKEWNPDVVSNISDIVKKWIAAERPVSRRNLDLRDLLEESGEITLVPGEVYPDVVHVLSTTFVYESNANEGLPIAIRSVEPCCGTHLFNTADIGSFVLTKVKSGGDGIRSIQGLCGKRAEEAEANAETALEMLEYWENHVEKEVSAGVIEKSLSAVRRKIRSWQGSQDKVVLPYEVRIRIGHTVNTLQSRMWNAFLREKDKQSLEQVEQLCESHDDGPLIHFFPSDFGPSSSIMAKATNVFNQWPILLLSKRQGVIHGHCSIPPQDAVNRGISASGCLECIKDVLSGGKLSVCKSRDDNDNQLLCNYTSNKKKHKEELLQKALLAGKTYLKGT